ncbi:MAG: EF-hand domain-containing protein [Micavibrio sp.]
MTCFKPFAFAALLAGAVALSPASASAEGTYGGGAQADAAPVATETFQTLDADRSGALNEAEYNKLSDAHVSFEQADINSDGQVTLSEFQSAQAGQQ